MWRQNWKPKIAPCLKKETEKAGTVLNPLQVWTKFQNCLGGGSAAVTHCSLLPHTDSLHWFTVMRSCATSLRPGTQCALWLHHRIWSDTCHQMPEQWLSVQHTKPHWFRWCNDKQEYFLIKHNEDSFTYAKAAVWGCFWNETVCFQTPQENPPPQPKKDNPGEKVMNVELQPFSW